MLKCLRILVFYIKGICVHYFLPVCFMSQNIVIFPMISQAVSGRTKKDLLPLIHLDRCRTLVKKKQLLRRGLNSLFWSISL